MGIGGFNCHFCRRLWSPQPLKAGLDSECTSFNGDVWDMRADLEENRWSAGTKKRVFAERVQQSSRWAPSARRRFCNATTGTRSPKVGAYLTGEPITICSDMASQTLTGSWVIYRALVPLKFLWGSKWLISTVVSSGLDTFFVSPDLLSREKLGHKTYMRLKRVGPSCQYPSFNSQYCPVVTHTIWANPLAAVRRSDIEYQMTDASKPPTYKTCKQSFRGTAELPYFRAPRQEAWCGPHRI